jgi:FG-GAP repeat
MRRSSPTSVSLLVCVVGVLALAAPGSVWGVAQPALPPVLTGPDTGAGPNVKGFLLDGTQQVSFLAFDPSFTGGVRVGAGDVNGDGTADIVTGAGPGSAGGHVKVFDGGTQALLRSFLAYDLAFAGGVYVAAGDVNSDGKADIVTGAGAGAPGGHVKIFDGQTGALLNSFFAFDLGFTGGAHVAAGDVNGDGVSDIVVGAGPGSVGGHVKVFDGSTQALLHTFLAYGPSFAGGIFVAAGDVNGDGFSDIVTGAGDGAPGGHVKAFSGIDTSLLRSFLAFDLGFTGGARVAAGDVNGDGISDIVVGAGPGSVGGHVKVFDGGTLALIGSFLAYGPSFAGGIYVASPGGSAGVPVSGHVYYDANTNGQRDGSEPGVAGWQVVRNGAHTVITNAQGTFVYFLSNIEQDNVFSQLPGLSPWLQTGNLVDQSSVTGGATVTLNADKSYSVHTVAGSTVAGLNFGDVCLGSGHAHGRGFWTSKHGQALIDAGDLALLSGLNLRSADGSHFDPASYGMFRDWMMKANAQNMAYMLSAQLAALALNVAVGDVSGESLVYAPGTTSANANGFATVNDLIAEANAELGSHGFVPGGSPARAYQELLKDALEAANANKTFVQPGPDACPPAFLP